MDKIEQIHLLQRMDFGSFSLENISQLLLVSIKR